MNLLREHLEHSFLVDPKPCKVVRRPFIPILSLLSVEVAH